MVGPSNAAHQQLYMKPRFTCESKAFSPNPVPAGWVDILPQWLAEQEIWGGDSVARRSKHDQEGEAAGGQENSFSVSVACLPTTVVPPRPEGQNLCCVQFPSLWLGGAVEPFPTGGQLGVYMCWGRGC